jgi:two-component system response regulator FlrC
VGETLRRKGFGITTASSGFEALGKLKNHFYQAVVTDVRMPELNGLELLKQVKRLSPTTPVILLTGHGTVADAVSALKNGAFDYLMKPFSANQLTEVVRKATSLLSDKEGTPVEIVTDDTEMKRLLEVASQAALSDAPILIQAESGTGKELLARHIHSSSDRSSQPFIALNCAAIPDELLESELFGHEKGAFTGASSLKMGRFELADGGSLLLDEIGEMSVRLQAKLLRVLQENEIDRVGGVATLPVDVRVIATTNRNLREKVQTGDFREDLYYRLNVIPLTIPPLRERRGDVPNLVNRFCQKYSNARPAQQFASETIELLKKYDWPGNVRELENVTRRALALATSPVISPADLFLDLEQDRRPSLELRAGMSIRELEKAIIGVTLQETDGNRTRAASLLGISLRTLRNKLREYRQQGDVF